MGDQCQESIRPHSLARLHVLNYLREQGELRRAGTLPGRHLVRRSCLETPHGCVSIILQLPYDYKPAEGPLYKYVRSGYTGLEQFA